MCCMIAALFAFGPRAAILIWYVLEPVRWNAAFDSFLWALAGFLVAPWTTLMFVLVYPAEITVFDYVWIVIGSRSTCSPGRAARTRPRSDPDVPGLRARLVDQLERRDDAFEFCDIVAERPGNRSP